MAGNRDFLVGPDMLAHCGIVGLADPTVLVAFDERLLLTHGDALCLADTDYQRFRAEVRGEAWQQRFLAQPLDERRRIAAGIRAESQQRKRSQTPEQWADVDADCAKRWMQAAQTTQLLHGHTHRPASHALGDGFMRHVLSDWDHDDAASPRGDVLRWTREGLARVAPAHG
jgi:UDP-2,3-diacylglucosamine hydrolase